jgi:hypothetical protein
VSSNITSGMGWAASTTCGHNSRGCGAKTHGFAPCLKLRVTPILSTNALRYSLNHSFINKLIGKTHFMQLLSHMIPRPLSNQHRRSYCFGITMLTSLSKSLIEKGHLNRYHKLPGQLYAPAWTSHILWMASDAIIHYKTSTHGGKLVHRT